MTVGCFLFFSAFMVMLVAGIGLWYEYLTAWVFVRSHQGQPAVAPDSGQQHEPINRQWNWLPKGNFPLSDQCGLALVIVDVAISTYYRTRTHWKMTVIPSMMTTWAGVYAVI